MADELDVSLSESMTVAQRDALITRLRTAWNNLPPATQAQHDFKPGMLNIAVDKAGAVWYLKNQISLPELGLVLSNRFRADTNLPVYISGDLDTLHGAMADVYEVVRGAGVQKVAFAVAPKQTESAR